MLEELHIDGKIVYIYIYLFKKRDLNLVQDQAQG